MTLRMFRFIVPLMLVAATTWAAPVELLSADESGIAIRIESSALTTLPVTTERGAFAAVEMEEEGFTSVIGAPRLPILRRLIDLPLGAECIVRVEDPIFREVVLDAPVLPLQPPRPKSGPEPAFAYDAAAYARSGYGDGALARVEEIGMARAHRLAEIVVEPVDYDPARNTILILESATIRIDFAGADEAATEAHRDRYGVDLFDRAVARAALNGVGERYLPSGEIGYLVISTPALYGDANLANLLAWKTQKGLHVTHVSTDVTGATKELIKAYIQNAFDTWDIPPTFVLLVGDTPAMPHWTGQGVGTPPTDLNYALLAGTDYLPDLAIGRFSVTNPSELQNIVAKTLSFEQVGWTGNDDWEKHATFMASEDNYTVSEGTHNYVISTYLQPLGYAYDKLYSHTYNATTQQVRDALNAGRSQATYSGHGADTYWADGPPFYQTDVRNLTNTVYPFVQSYACITGNFPITECFSETWIRAPRAGVACMASSVNSYWTEDDILEKRVYEGFYNDQYPSHLVDQTWIGGMMLYGKLRYYEHFGNTTTTRRYLEMYNLMGDPSIDVWTAVPRTAQVTAPASLLAGQTSFDVSVALTPYAMVSAQKTTGGNAIFVTAWADAGGHATVTLPEPLTPGTLTLAVTAHDLRPYFTTIQVIQPSGPYLIYESCRIDDYDENDGAIDAGEPFGLAVTLENIGVDTATGLTAGIGCDDPYLESSVPVEYTIPDIPPGGFGTMEHAIAFVFRGDAPDQHLATFDWRAHGNEGDWAGEFTCTINAPVLVAGSCLVDDSAPGGDGNGVPDPAETFYLQMWLQNTGHCDARDVAGLLSSADPRIVVHDGEGSCLHAPVGQDGLLSAFRVEISGDCPAWANIPMHLSLDCPTGYAAEIDFTLVVGAFVDNAENDLGWTIGAAGDNAASGIWVRADPVGTTYNGQQCQPENDHTEDPGHICWVTGNGSVGGAAGEQDVDGGKTTLLSPVFDLEGASSATVGYWRWYTNNLGNNPSEDYWDVDATADGVNWVHLEHTMTSQNSWTYQEFDLGSRIPLTDRVQLRFVAQDLTNNSLLEAAVDDFMLDVERGAPTDAPDWVVSGESGLVSVRPNPFNPRTSITVRFAAATRADLSLFDVAGRKVRTLLNGPAAAGETTLLFDGRDDRGGDVPSGIYFLKLDTPERLQIRQVTLLK